MENEIRNATSLHQINSILRNCAGQYDLDMITLSKADIGIGVSKGIIDMPIVGGSGSVTEFTGQDVYSVQSLKTLNEVKDLVIKSIRYRDLTSPK